MGLSCMLDVVNLGGFGGKLGSPILPDDEGLRGAHQEPPRLTDGRGEQGSAQSLLRS